jgi:hypothetical protein
MHHGDDEVSSFKNASGALVTRNESEAKLAWPERSGGNSVSREEGELLVIA